MKTVIVCASRYGSTLEIGHWIAERLPLQKADVFSVEDAPSPESYDLVFLGGGVYNEQVDKAIVHYADAYVDVLQDKKIVAFAVCLDTRGVYMKGRFYGGWMYLDPLLEILKPLSLIHAGVLSGEINPNKLSEKDYGLLMHFYTKILKRDLRSVPFRTKMNKVEVWAFVQKALSRLDGRY